MSPETAFEIKGKSKTKKLRALTCTAQYHMTHGCACVSCWFTRHRACSTYGFRESLFTGDCSHGQNTACTDATTAVPLCTAKHWNCAQYSNYVHVVMHTCVRTRPHTPCPSVAPSDSLAPSPSRETQLHDDALATWALQPRSVLLFVLHPLPSSAHS